MKLSKYIFFTTLLGLLFVSGCGSPFKDKGFKSEADYEFAKSAELNPLGVDAFKAVGVLNASQFNAVKNEMHATGYSDSNYINAILTYAEDKFEGAKMGISALEMRKRRHEEAAQSKAKKIEAERLEAKKRADEKSAKDAADKAIKDAREQRILASKKYVNERRQALQKSGVVEANMIDLIVNFKSLKGRQVFLTCNIYAVDASSGFCRSLDEKQYIPIDSASINKSDYKNMLTNCSAHYYDQNHDWCRSMPIVATLAGSSTPRLTNVSLYNLCEKRRYSSKYFKYESDECYID